MTDDPSIVGVSMPQMMVGINIASMSPQQDQPLTMKACAPHKCFTNKDLPFGTLDRWRELFIPMWTDFIGTRMNLWNTNILDKAQELWDSVFPTNHQVLTQKGVIFQLVSDLHRVNAQ